MRTVYKRSAIIATIKILLEVNRLSASEIDLIDAIIDDQHRVTVEIQEIGHVHDHHAVITVKGMI